MKDEIVTIDSNQVERIEKLARLTWPDTFKAILSEEQIEYMLNWMYNTDTLKEQISEGHLFYIIKEGEKDVGFIGLQPNYKGSSDLRIHKIYVLPETQGSGFGRALLRFASKSVAQDYNCLRLHLNVNKYNNAVQFYKKYGFSIESEEDIDIGNGFWMNDYVMVKEIN